MGAFVSWLIACIFDCGWVFLSTLVSLWVGIIYRSAGWGGGLVGVWLFLGVLDCDLRVV